MKPTLEQIPLSSQQSILAFEFVRDDFDAPWHFHPQYELTLILESSGTRFTGDHVGPYESGELVLLAGNLPHCWKNEAHAIGQCRSVVIQWNAGIFPNIPELNPLERLLSLSHHGIHFSPETAAPFLTRVCELTNLQETQLYLSLLQLLCNLAEEPFETLSEAAFTDGLPLAYSTRMARIHEFVQTHYARKVYLRELAELLHMSEQSFSRFFSKMMGRPFFTFLNEYRINVAGRMLLETDLPVAQVAYACGYESLPFFHRQFGKFKEKSPLAYRKAYAKRPHVRGNQ